MTRVWFFISIILFLGNLWSNEQLFSLETLVIETLEDKINLTPYLEYFIDESGKLNINDLIEGEGDKLFKTSDKKSLNLGYTRKPIWIRFTLDLEKFKDKIILELENELISYIDIYYLDSNNSAVHFSATGLSLSTNLGIFSGTYLKTNNKYIRAAREIENIECSDSKY